MRKAIIITVVAGVVVILGGLVFLATWDIRPTTNVVEKNVPNERLPK